MILLDKLSNEEKEAIQEFRTRMENDLPKHMLKDSTLLFYRFLKARDFDVDKAEKMLRKHINWQKHFQIDTILKDFTPKPFFKLPKLSHLGFDKKGNMVKYLPLGNLEAKDLLKCVQINHYMRHWIWHFEEINEEAKQLGENSIKRAQITAIFDLDKLTVSNAISKASMEICVRLMHILQDNYPECLNAVYVINTPAYYRFIYSILKPMMSAAFMRKINICSNNGWQETLLEVIDADLLPAFLGGNRTDPDGNPLCNTFVGHGGEVPEKYYLSEEERDFTNRSLVKRITVHSKQKEEITVHVPEVGSLICWEFLIRSKNIGFGIFFKKSESELEEILPAERYDTIDGVEKGSYKTQTIGNYVIVFDNSYSWMNAKEVDYCITVLISEV